MTVPFKLPVSEPTLKDLLDLTKKDIMLSLNCHALATIQSFNSTAKTVTATINYGKTYYQQQTDGTYEAVVVNYPTLTDVPVICLGGGATALSFPIAQGDQAIILFNDRDIDNWTQGSNTGSPASCRLHSLADGIALVGLNKISGYDAVRALLSNGTVMVGINPSNNKITATNGTYDLGTLLQNLCTQLTNLTSALATLTVSGVTTGGGVSGVPVNAATITGVGTNISTIKTQLAGLLE